MPYASPSDMFSRFDVRRIGQLVGDAGTMVSQAALLTDTNLLQALDDATGLIDTAILRGRRYLPTDLAVLTGSNKAVLARLTCVLAYQMLVERRGNLGGDEVASPSYKWAMDMLERLSTGERVFNIASALDAGLPRRVVLSRNVQLISSARRLFGDLVVNPSNPGSPADFGS